MSDREIDRKCLRLDYTRQPEGFLQFTMEEQERLNPGTCPCCSNTTRWKRVESAVGGKYLAYLVHQCEHCNWWNVSKFWEDLKRETVFSVKRLEPQLYDFSNRHANVSAVLGLLKRDFHQLRELHWRVFEQLVQRLLSEQGFRVVDVAQYPSAGGDLLLFGLDGRCTLVEVKHLRYDPVSVSVVHKLRSVIQHKGYEAGLIVTSNRFSKNALDLMRYREADDGATDEQHAVSGKDFIDIMRWLDLIELRSTDEVNSVLEHFISDDIMSEQ